MTRLPRDLSGRELAKLLRAFGYEVTRQTGGHMRLTTEVRGEHHITIPDHGCLRVGTLALILAEVADHLDIDREILRRKLFG